MIAAWKRLELSSEREFGKLLATLYEKESLSQKIIGERLGVDTSCIENWFKRLKLPRRTHSDSTFIRHQRDRVSVVLSPREYEVLDGLMLGDGSLEKQEGGRSARYTHGGKYKETLLTITKDLPSLKFSDPWPYRGYWFFKSLSYAQLLPVWERWYGGGGKKVPSDIVLSPETCYQWYVGDGCIYKPNVRRDRCRYYLQLSTDGFPKVGVELLVSKLTACGFYCSRRSDNRIAILSSSVPSFLSFIGPCKNSEYAYKWAYNKPKWTFRRVCPRGIKCKSAL